MTTARRFQLGLQEVRRNAASRASNLKFKVALLALVVLPFYVLSWLFGAIWYAIKYLLYVMVEGFHKGSRKDSE